MERKKQIGPFGVLTGTQIEKLKIIVFDDKNDFDKTCYNKASYNLRLGAEYYKPSLNGGKTEIDPLCEENPHCPHRDYVLKNNLGNCNTNNKVLIIKPYTSVVISTLERLKLPPNVVGRFDLKIRWALQGLILQVGTQVAPGYNGRLFGLLHNLSKKEICIPMKIGIFDAEFSFTSNKVVPEKFDKTYETLQGFLESRPPIEGTLEAFLQDVRKEKEEIQKRNKESIEQKKDIDETIKEIKKELKTNQENIRKEISDSENQMSSARMRNLTISISVFAAIVTLSLSVGIPLIITKFTVDKDDYPFLKVYEMETKNLDLYKKVDSIITVNQNTINDLFIKYNGAKDSIKNLNLEINSLKDVLTKQNDDSKTSQNGE